MYQLFKWHAWKCPAMFYGLCVTDCVIIPDCTRQHTSSTPASTGQSIHYWSAPIQWVQEHMYTKACGKNTDRKKKTNINLLSIVVFHLTWKVSREARFWLTSGQTASIQGHWQTKSSWIAFSIARALYAPPDEIWDESLYVNTRVLRNQTWGDNTPTHLPHATRKMQTAQCSMYCFLACCSLLHRGRGAG